MSSVVAFVSRCLSDGNPLPEADEVLAVLSPDERRVIEALATTPDPGERLRRLTRETGEPWSAERYQRLEARAQRRLARELSSRCILQG